MINKSHYNEDLLYNNRFSTEHKILSFSDEIATKKDTEKVYAC